MYANNKLYSVLVLMACIMVTVLGQDNISGYPVPGPMLYSMSGHDPMLYLGAYPDRRNYDRDGLLVSNTLANGMMPGQYDEEGHYPMGAGPYPMAAGAYPMAAGHYPMAAGPMAMGPMAAGPMAMGPMAAGPMMARNYPMGGYPMGPQYFPNADPYMAGGHPGPSPYMMPAGDSPYGPAMASSMQPLAYAPAAAAMPPLMASTPAPVYYNRISPAAHLMSAPNPFTYLGPPRIEIGQKLSNSIYANSDNLRYDLTSLKDNYQTRSPSYSSYSSSTNHASSYPSQTSTSSSLSYSPPSSSSTSSSSSSLNSLANSLSSDYALASNGYRQYLNQQQSLLTNPSLYNRMQQYLPYLSGNKYPSSTSASGYLGDNGNSRSQSVDSFYSKGDYYKSGPTAAASSSSSSSSSSGGSSSSLTSDLLSASKVSKVNSPKEELGFFKRSDPPVHEKVN